MSIEIADLPEKHRKQAMKKLENQKNGKKIK